jgi:hypothetical protein
VLTAGQFNIASSAYGIAFQPEMMTATVDAHNVVSYGVGSFNGEANSSTATDAEGNYLSDITPAIELMGALYDNYITVSRGFAVRLALQGGLSEYAAGLEYDAATDQYRATTDRELAPMFEAIFAGAPDGADNAYDYLVGWNEILEVVYPDYHVDTTTNLLTGAMKLDESFVLQMAIPAFETIGIDCDLAAVMNALGCDETRLVQGSDATVSGGSGDDSVYVSDSSDQVYQGGQGRDVHFVGKDFGHDIIDDVEPPIEGVWADELRFTQARSTEVYATRDGQDLVLEIRDAAGAATGDVLRVRDQFLGDLMDPLFGVNAAPDTGVTDIVFADGVIWDAFQISVAVSHPLDSDDLVLGSESRDYLEGGKGSDVLRGGRDGDIYVFRADDGRIGWSYPRGALGGRPRQCRVDRQAARPDTVRLPRKVA